MSSNSGTTLPRVTTALALAVAATAGLVGTTGIAAATALTITTRGIISQGEDHGLYGTNGSLAGRKFIVSQTFDLEDRYYFRDSYPHQDLQIGRYSRVSTSITVDGVTHTYNSFSGTAFLVNLINPNYGDDRKHDAIYGGQNFRDSFERFRVIQEVSIRNDDGLFRAEDDFLSSSSLDDQSVSYVVPFRSESRGDENSKTLVWINDYSTGVYGHFDGRPTSLVVTADGAAVGTRVPEPASLALLGAGLIGLTAARRARTRGQAPAASSSHHRSNSTKRP